MEVTNLDLTNFFFGLLKFIISRIILRYFKIFYVQFYGNKTNLINL